jgi:hypothetical protein
MKSFISAISIVIGLGASGMAYAECPDSLSYDLMIDCIVVEGAGSEFDLQAALEIKELEKQVEAQKHLSTASTE